MWVDVSVKAITLLAGFVHVKFATGAVQNGVGAAVAVGVGVGPPGGAVGVAVGAGVGTGVAVGPGPEVSTGAVLIWAVALELKVTFWPPVKIAMSGVIRWKCPVTVTVTLDPIPLAQPAGLQLRATSAGATVTNDDCVSLTARHMTRLVTALHAALGVKEVGSSDASIAPSRAALTIVIRE